MNKGFKWIGWGIALLLFLVFVGYLVWISLEQRSLDRAKAALMAQGESFAMQDFVTPTIPDDQNGSLDFAAAISLLKEETPAWNAWDNRQFGTFITPLTESEQQTAATVLSDNAAALQRLIAARGKKLDAWREPMQSPYLLTVMKPKLNSERSLANVLALAAKSAASQGNDREAIARLNDLGALAEASSHRPLLVAHLVADGIYALQADTVAEVAAKLQAKDQLASLQSSLQNEQAMIDSRRYSWRSERISILDMLDNVTSNSPQLSLATLIRPLILRDERLVTDHLQEVLKASDSADWPTANAHMPTRLPALVQANPKQHLFLSILLPALSRVSHKDYEIVAQRRLAVLAIAIRRYSLDHQGKLPGKLEDLVPTYLEAVPIDPMSGQFVKYIADGNDPRVYSVGEDGHDDGGIEWDFNQPRRKGQTFDLVAHLGPKPRSAATQPSDD